MRDALQLSAGRPRYEVRFSGRLSLTDTTESTLAQLARLDSFRYVRGPFSLRVDLSDVQSFDAASLVYLCSRIKLIADSGGNEVCGTHPTNPAAMRALREADFESFLANRPSRRPTDPHSLVLYRSTASEQVRRRYARGVHEFLTGADPSLDIQERDHIYLAAMECIENVRKHAAHAHADVGSSTRWYMVGLYDQERGVSSVAILDEGVGIRKSSSRKRSILNKVADQLRGLPTSGIIKEATLGTRTESGEKKHGKGLRSLREFVVASTERRLHVLSDDGMVTWRTANDCVERTIEPVRGTIVCLEIGGSHAAGSGGSNVERSAH